MNPSPPQSNDENVKSTSNNEGNNGRRVWTREQLLYLRESPLSKLVPPITLPELLKNNVPPEAPSEEESDFPIKYKQRSDSGLDHLQSAVAILVTENGGKMSLADLGSNLRQKGIIWTGKLTRILEGNSNFKIVGTTITLSNPIEVKQEIPKSLPPPNLFTVVSELLDEKGSISLEDLNSLLQDRFPKKTIKSLLEKYHEIFLVSATKPKIVALRPPKTKVNPPTQPVPIASPSPNPPKSISQTLTEDSKLPPSPPLPSNSPIKETPTPDIPGPLVYPDSPQPKVRAEANDKSNPKKISTYQSPEVYNKEVTDFLSIFPVLLRNQLQTTLESTDKRLYEIYCDDYSPPVFSVRFIDGSVKEVAAYNFSLNDHYGIISRNFGANNQDKIGIPGTFHSIRVLKNKKNDVIGLIYRFGCLTNTTNLLLRDFVVQRLFTTRNFYIFLGAPGVGKTTLLREIALISANVLSKRVHIIDTNDEICGFGDKPNKALPKVRRTSLQSRDTLSETLLEVTKMYSPEIIIIDELESETELKTARQIYQRGVSVLCGLPFASLTDLLLEKEKASLALSDKQAFIFPEVPTVVFEILRPGHLRVYPPLKYPVDVTKIPNFDERWIDTSSGSVRTKQFGLNK